MAQIPVQGSAGLPTTLVVGGRSVPVLLPNAYNARTKRYRLGLFLHSYDGTALSTLNRWFASSGEARNAGKGMVCLLPSGTIDTLGRACWNASDPCCTQDHAGPPSDVNFLRDLILLAQATYAVDACEVYGYSNGAMMAHTLALCQPSLVQAVYAFAGYAPAASDSHFCTTVPAVHVTQVHGAADAVVLEPGDPTGANVTDKPVGIYPGSPASCNAWAARNGCTGSLTQYDAIDATAATAGNETERYSYPVQATNGSVEYWKVTGALADHNVGMNTNFLRAVELRGYQARRT